MTAWYFCRIGDFVIAQGDRVNMQTLQTELKQFNTDELRVPIIRLVQHGDYKTAKWIGEVTRRYSKNRFKQNQQSINVTRQLQQFLVMGRRLQPKPSSAVFAFVKPFLNA
jgi:hypothetical protein